MRRLDGLRNFETVYYKNYISSQPQIIEIVTPENAISQINITANL